jgi:predicted dehydrogenase
MEGFMFRFHGLFQTVQQMLLPSAHGPLLRFSGDFGFLLSEMRRSADRLDPSLKMGALNEIGCYPLCAARILFGRPPKLVTKAQVTALADMPSKLELRAKLVGTINAPVSGFVNVLAGNIRSLVNVLNAVAQKG